MTDLIAKLISLRILVDWESRKVWMVRHQISDSMSEYKWFKSEEMARSYARMLTNATVQAGVVPVPFEFTADMDEARRRLTAALDARREAMQRLEYSYEPARG